MTAVSCQESGLKFVEEAPKATADPSTSFGSRNEPNFAQDDSFVVSGELGTTH
jgi:hypothetical protein